MLDHWMRKFDFSDYLWVLQPLPKKDRDGVYARCWWNHAEREVTFEFGATVGYTEPELEAIVVHEISHGLMQTVMKDGDMRGTLADEQACNLLARLLVPECPRPMRPTTKPKWAEMGKHFSDDEREILEDALPHLIVRLPAQQRAVLCALVYDGRSLRDVAREYSVDQKSIRNWRDEAIASLRSMFVGDDS